MKHFLLIISFFLFITCQTSKKVVEQKTKVDSLKCPDDGICTFEVLKNKSLDIKEDEFGNSYPIISNSNTLLLKYEYKKNEPPNTADGNYSEFIYVEFKPNIKGITLKDAELSDAKVVFARICFCRGQTGYYYVKKGTLLISKENDDSYSFSLNFEIDEVPQIITGINERFTISE